MKSVFFSVNLIVLLLSLSFGISAQRAGSLDTSFGSGGTVITNFNQRTEFYDMVVQPDKKIVVVGNTFEPTNVQIIGLVARFNENGTRDLSFDGDGYINSGILKECYTVAISTDGKILAGGYNFGAGGQGRLFSIARLNTNGSLDTTFGGGVINTNVGAIANINSLQVLPDGKILALGRTQLINGNSLRDFALVKYNTDGTPDTTFGTNGRVTTDLGSDEVLYDSALQPDGKIIAVGYHVDPLSTQRNGLIIRYNSDGSIDTAFGNNGKILQPGFGNAGFSEIALQSDGKFIPVGPGISITRYNSNGVPDINFQLPPTFVGNTLTIQPNGKVIVFRFSNFALGDYELVRYNQNGTLDISFGIGGILPLSVFLSKIVLAPDDKIVVGANIGNSLGIERYLNNGPPFMDFDGDSKTDVSIFRPSNGQWWFLRSSDNSNYALQFGVSDDKIVPADYTGDGKTDVAIYRPSTGEWFVLRSEDFSYYAFPFGISTDTPVPADYDGDSKADAAVFRASSGTWYINNSTTGNTQITNFGINGDRPVQADYDGDGKTDIAIYRPTGGNASWWIRRSFNESVFNVITPSATAPVLIGDFTGDGKADFSYFIGGNTSWNIVRSEDLSTVSTQFGQPGDILTPGDYDGDGKFDLATFRPSNNTWNIRRSSDGGIVQQTFGTSGDIPTPNVNVR